MKLSPDQLMAGVLEAVFTIRPDDDLGIGDTQSFDCVSYQPPRAPFPLLCRRLPFTGEADACSHG